MSGCVDQEKDWLPFILRAFQFLILVLFWKPRLVTHILPAVLFGKFLYLFLLNLAYEIFTPARKGTLGILIFSSWPKDKIFRKEIWRVILFIHFLVIFSFEVFMHVMY